MVFAHPIQGIWLRRSALAALTLLAVTALQPAAWFPSMIGSASRFQDVPAPHDLRPGPVTVLNGNGLIATAPGRVQSTTYMDRPSGTANLILEGMPQDTRVFANGILLDADDGETGDIQVFPVPPAYLQDGNNRFDLIHQGRDASGTGFVAVVRSDTAEWRVRTSTNLPRGSL